METFQYRGVEVDGRHDLRVRPLGGFATENGLSKSWRSSESFNCVQAGALETHSGEVVGTLLGDTKTGQIMRLGTAAYTAFIEAVKRDEFSV